MTYIVRGAGAAALCLVAALVLVTADARQGTSVLMGKTQMLAGGLEVTTVTPGSGNVAAASGDTVKVQYSGKLANGEVFDSGDISFPLGQGHVIKGWDLVRIILLHTIHAGTDSFCTLTISCDKDKGGGECLTLIFVSSSMQMFAKRSLNFQ